MSTALSSPRVLVGGELVGNDLTPDVVDPSTGEVLLTVPRATRAQAEAAVAGAKAAYPAWRATSAERRTAVNRFADVIETHRDELAAMLVREQGKPLSQAKDEIDSTSGFVRADARIDLPVEVVHEDDDFRMEVHQRHLGVVVGMGPWNFPVFLMTLKVAAAVLARNTFVAKPAPSTPVTAMMIGELAADILPPGVLNVAIDDDLGPALTGHPDVAKISFTGSTATGKKVAAAAAASLKRVLLAQLTATADTGPGSATRASARSFASCASTRSRRCWRWSTPRPSVSAARCGPGTRSAPTRSHSGSTPGRCGSTTTCTCIRACLSRAPRSRASGPTTGSTA
jgi:delta 1-pyrroline-5-carboxylate dehydrogenase